MLRIFKDTWVMLIIGIFLMFLGTSAHLLAAQDPFKKIAQAEQDAGDEDEEDEDEEDDEDDEEDDEDEEDEEE